MALKRKPDVPTLENSNPEVLLAEKQERLVFLRDAFLFALADREPFWEKAREWMAYAEGDHWSEKEKAEMARKKKPALTFDHIGGGLDVWCGFERDNRRQVRAIPIEEHDTDDAEIVTAGIREVDRWSNAEYEKSEAIADSFKMGEGILSWLWDDFSGKFRIARESIFNHLPDPRCLDRTWARSRRHFRFQFLSKTEIEEMWPDTGKEVTETRPTIGFGVEAGRSFILSPETGYGLTQYEGDYNFGQLPEAWKSEGPEFLLSKFYDAEARLFRVIEAWERILHPLTVVYRKTRNGTEEFYEEVPWQVNPDTGKIEQDAAEIEAITEKSTEFVTKVVKRVVWRLTVFAGDVELEHRYTNFARLPFVPVYYHLSTDGIRKNVWGWVKRLVDPSRAYNKMKSQMHHIVNKIAAQTTLLSRSIVGTNPDVENAIKNFADVVVVESANLTEGQGYITLKPAPMGGELFQAITDLRQEIQFLSGLDAQAMMGVTDKGDPSGFALDRKRAAGLTRVTTPFDNIRESTLALYKDLVYPTLCKSDMVFRIRREKQGSGGGPFKDMASLPINTPFRDLRPEEKIAWLESRVGQKANPEALRDPALVAQMIAEADQQFGNEIVNKIAKVNVDIILDESTLTPTERVRQLQVLINAAKSGLPVPPELIYEYMDEPAAKKLLEIQRAQRNNPANQGGAPAPPAQGSGGAVPISGPTGQ